MSKYPKLKIQLDLSIPQENQCYWVHPVERGLDHDIGDPADDVLDHGNEEADPNDTFAPSDCIACQFENLNKVV